MTAMRMPWTSRTMPHGTLDILRGCNIRCPACYNTRPAHIKPLSQIERELDQLLAIRSLHTLTITGGEPTLHPQLCQIIELVRNRDLVPTLVTNGLLLDDQRLSAYKQSGLQLATVHIDQGQVRSDLPENATSEQVNELRRQKGALIASHGIEAGLATTAYRSRIHNLVEVVQLLLHSSDIHFLLVTNCSRVGQITSLKGSLDVGIEHGDWTSSTDDGMEHEVVEAADAIQCLKDDLGLYPFGYMGSNLDPADPRWISYMVAAVTDPDGRHAYHSLRPSLTERLAIHMIHLLRGRFEFHQHQSRTRLRAQLLLNAMTGGNLLGNLAQLCRSLRMGRKLSAKHILIMSPGGLTADGRVVYCRNCPDATIHAGRLMPPCLTDRFDQEENQVTIPN